MERLNQQNYVFLFFSLIIVLGLVSLSLCLAAEFSKSKKNDLRIDENLCYLPESPAFGLGIAGLISLFAGQVIGNLFICVEFIGRDHRRDCGHKFQRPTIASTFLVCSWISFGMALILISVATSMSQRQPFGEGWLDGECYMVKSGVYSGSGALAVLAIGLTLGSAFLKTRQRRVEEDRKVHAQFD